MPRSRSGDTMERKERIRVTVVLWVRDDLSGMLTQETRKFPLRDGTLSDAIRKHSLPW